MGVGHLRRTTRSATLVVLSAGLVACVHRLRPHPAARAAAPAVHVEARRAASTPSLTLTTGYAAINEGTVNPVTVRVTFPVAITSGTIGLTGANAPHCTPLALGATTPRVTSTCWNTAGSPGTATLRATATVTGRRPLGDAVVGTGVRITITRRVPPDVPVTTYRRTSSCGNDTPYVWLTFDDYGSPPRSGPSWPPSDGTTPGR